MWSRSRSHRPEHTYSGRAFGTVDGPQTLKRARRVANAGSGGIGSQSGWGMTDSLRARHDSMYRTPTTPCSSATTAVV
jgi:hypothetical protein